MNRRGLLLILALAVAAGLWWLWPDGSGEDYANLPPAATGPWVALGDSLTRGEGASEGHDYPSLLAARLGVPILNLGRSGDTTADALARLDTVTRLQPRVVLLCLGGNDGLQGRSPAAMIANLRAIITRLQAQGAFVVLIGVRSPSLLRDRNAGRFRQLARETRVFYVPDILEGVLGHPALMADPVHPNDEGYRHIAERLEKALRPLLPRLGPGPEPAGAER